jgi:hypothetical protein
MAGRGLYGHCKIDVDARRPDDVYADPQPQQIFNDYRLPPCKAGDADF